MNGSLRVQTSWLRFNLVHRTSHQFSPRLSAAANSKLIGRPQPSLARGEPSGVPRFGTIFTATHSLHRCQPRDFDDSAMRSLDSARGSWQELKQYQSLAELKEAVRLNGNISIATEGGRSACWKAFLLFDSLDVSIWQRTLSSSRSAYNSVRSHFLRHLENQDELEAEYDPLAQDSEVSESLSSTAKCCRSDSG